MWYYTKDFLISFGISFTICVLIAIDMFMVYIKADEASMREKDAEV